MIGKLKGAFEHIFDAFLMMVKVLLPRAEFECNDAAEAIALCRRVHRSSISYLSKIMV
ncbi:hypothetical protein ME1_00509 [Bartonella vinsonii subsp. arupensis OK-94-513]|uniref:Uncharacterized protein n=1 Tax=Bartonella vinsonii subsp. arupensis OK-94-513 TaxID=1094562 RepID=J0R2E1_BARVI|nr:hypothetical protein [Bartonella vinsonii]EJF89739.1 hypothetical protein ME1_00509 [Bartonella vinsonii subsp. arupensis OK-94-513]